MPLTIIDTELPDVKLVDLNVHHDERGYFLELFQARRYEELLGLRSPFVQDNYSYSKRNVLRGLHFQCRYPQGQLLRVIQGEIYGVAVDVRPYSPTFRQWQGLVLSDAKPQQL